MMQDAINAKPDQAFLTSWLNVDVTRALLKRVLQEPVHDLYYVRIVRLGRLHAPQLEHLLEVGDGGHLSARFR